ncbi:uncharacterized protein PRCAT00001889001 [Priceomyces carsonii]|uniref:uncharacterized protein n=1 Tax=Priceomyces carsonii TaxID=28549 RepID=UPI002ED821EC|nr:unnamed protein product [Priceomyces carsonii]
MALSTREQHRKSRAPWQSSGHTSKLSNPYSRANAVNTTQDSLDTLQLPHQTGSRKNTRRLSIHASAAAQAHGRSLPQGAQFDASNLPPVPKFNQNDNGSADSLLLVEKEKGNEFADIEKKIFKELSNGTATEIDDYYKVLVKQKSLITKDIKTSINQNQQNIIELTKELRDTQDELVHLRISTKQLYEVLDEFKESAERRMELEIPRTPLQSKSSKAKRKDRSSVMVLKKMWATELQSLFKHVEGASKFVQPLPGRHVLAESGRWYEVNVGTWKPVKAAHLFILNDLFLIAVKKGSQEGGNESRLQAIQCLPLSETKLSDMTSSQAQKDEGKTYFIGIKSKALSYVFQTDRYDHFLKITEAYNKGISESFHRKRLMDAERYMGGATDLGQTEDEKRQLRESLRNSGIADSPHDEKRRSGPQRQSSEVILQDISARVHSRNRSHDFESVPGQKFGDNNTQTFNDLRKLEDRLDEVDVEISNNRHAESVGLIKYIENKLDTIEKDVNGIENIHLSNSVDELKLLIDVIKLKINTRKLRIQQSLAFDLHDNIDRLTHSEVYQIIEYFYIFNQLNKVISLYLQGSSDYLASIMSKLAIGVQGSTVIDVVNYVSNLIIVSASIIKRTIIAYQECVIPILKKDKQSNVDSSGLINWCIEEATQLSESVKKHLYGTLLVSAGPDPETGETKYKVKDEQLFKEFIDNTKPYLDNLKSVGVNINFLFDDIFELYN